MLSRYRGRGFYDPLSEMNRLFGEMFGGPARRQGTGQEQQQQVTGWVPAIDVIQRDEDRVVRAEIPGARPEDVDITVQNGVLTISGELEEEREKERQGYLVRERRYGTFRRSLQLPQDVNEDQINARFENGVLEVTVPGAAAGREPKRIQVEGGSSSRGEQGDGGLGRSGTEGSSVRSPRTEEARESGRRQPESEREEDEGLLDRAKEAILGEEEESRRRERTDRPEDRR
jgi:HSP20 family protein